MIKDITEETSEFGKGFVYCLALFIGHQARFHNEMTTLYESHPSLWFNGAADHLFELMPEHAPTEELKKRCLILQDKALNWRLAPCKKEDIIWALQEAKDILREVDLFHKVPAIKGDYE